MNKKLFGAISTLTGTVIGAGFLGIPYVVAKSGFLIGLFWMVVICLVMMFVNLVVGEIVLSTKRIHQLPGYSSKYLGRKTKIYVFIASIIGFYAALIAYLLGEGESLSFILTGTTNYSLYFGIGFWILMAFLTFGGIRKFKKIEPLAVSFVFLVTLLLGIANFSKLSLNNISQFRPQFLFLPFGVILFAFLGMTSIPEIGRILKKNKKLMRKAIIIGSIIPLFVYLLFTIVVLGLFGQNVREIATISFGSGVTFLGMLTMFTAFMALSLALEDTFRFDFNMGFKKAWALTLGIPLIFFLIIKIFNLADFVKLLSIGGSISGGMLAIALLLIHEAIAEKKVKRERKPEFKIRLPLLIKILFIILFITGIIYEFL